MSENPSPNPSLKKHEMYVLVNQQIDHVHLMPIQQCSPLTERALLLRSTHWSPHLLCAYQTQTHLNLVMEYAEGGTLWDVLESVEGTVKEPDLKWWAGQCVSAIGWCHNQGFAHRCAHLPFPIHSFSC